MARAFSKNLANHMSLGINGLGGLAGAAAISFHALVRIASVSTGANDNSILQIINVGTGVAASLNIDGSGGVGLERRVRANGRSVSTDARAGRTGTTNIPLSTWVAIGGVMNFAADTITPYYEGAAENGGAVVFANTTFTLGTATVPDGIGTYAPGTASDTLASHFDGDIAEFAIWNGDIGAANFEQLANRLVPYKVARAMLAHYWPLDGRDSVMEPDLISKKSGTISGSIPISDHPRVIR